MGIHQGTKYLLVFITERSRAYPSTQFIDADIDTVDNSFSSHSSLTSCCRKSLVNGSPRTYFFDRLATLVKSALPRPVACALSLTVACCDSGQRLKCPTERRF